MANFSILLITCNISFFFLLSGFCHSLNVKRLLNVSKSYQTYSSYDSDPSYGSESSYDSDTSYDSESSYDSDSDWINTVATWYGGPYGAGSDGGSCGYETAVDAAPFNSLITAVAPQLYNLGCGQCYQVKCTSSEHCSGNPVTVVATDSCPGCDHLFDLSGSSMGAMANYGDADNLRNVGRVQVQYKSVPCDFVGVNVAFRVDPGSNNYYFAMAVEYEDGSGKLSLWIRKAFSTDSWIPMTPLWGAVYMVNFPGGITGPFSIKLTDGPQTIVAENVIPANYEKDIPYKSNVNFHV